MFTSIFPISTLRDMRNIRIKDFPLTRGIIHEIHFSFQYNYPLFSGTYVFSFFFSWRGEIWIQGVKWKGLGYDEKDPD